MTECQITQNRLPPTLIVLKNMFRNRWSYCRAHSAACGGCSVERRMGGMSISYAVIVCLIFFQVVTYSVVSFGDQGISTASPSTNMNWQITNGTEFLKHLHGLVLNPPMTPEKIKAALGWSILRQTSSERGRSTYFDLFPSAPWANPSLEEASDGKTRIKITLGYSALCISAEEVLSEFGNEYQPTMAIVEDAPDKSQQSEIVKRNLRLFAHGPKYRIGNPARFEIHFPFEHSECLTSIAIGHPSF